MRAHVKLLFKPNKIIHPSFDQRFGLTTIPLKLAEATYMTVDDADILVQSISHHLVDIQLYDYNLKTDFVVDFEVTRDLFFLIAMQDDSPVLHEDDNEGIFEILGNTCILSYLKAGKYKRNMTAGKHQILSLSIKSEWFIPKYGPMEELKEFINSFKTDELLIFRLPSFNITQQLFNSLKKLGTLAEHRDVEIDSHIFLNECLSRYLFKLGQGMVTIKYQENKATEIAKFVKKNYASKIVGDEAELAQRFMISTTMLIRLAKLAFNRPLHQHVIELRMHHGLKLLLTTQKTIREISVSVGYDDHKYFSRAFKKKFGIPPNEIRISTI
ncbi:helix-turn-helix transcriptional regulator [Pedobacter gandavensis]|uniref:helix-turn-helix transcriptional regulator n=1 Tax=Pedobacter gandavensis TaxID=2679963 RepID=UPI002478A657|nr:helix-turn-helix transcriptional regulator [Pedobacter gandavensis]WGQ11153.1 helix-turn-helix transcriptional regulator [Pedobacter gandavensis]